MVLSTKLLQSRRYTFFIAEQNILFHEFCSDFVFSFSFPRKEYNTNLYNPVS